MKVFPFLLLLLRVIGKLAKNERYDTERENRQTQRLIWFESLFFRVLSCVDLDVCPLSLLILQFNQNTHTHTQTDNT